MLLYFAQLDPYNGVSLVGQPRVRLVLGGKGERAMRSRVGWFFRAKRLKQGMSVEALAGRLGYRNVRKGAHRLLRFERDGQCSDEFLVRLTDVLGLSAHVVLDLLTRNPGPWPEAAFWSDRLVTGEFCHSTASHGVHPRDQAQVGQGQAESGRKR